MEDIVIGFPNTFHLDKWKLNISNIPVLPGDKIDVKMYNLYAKGVILPTLTQQNINSNFLTSTIRHPISRINNDLQQLIIEFKLDENLNNYFHLFNYLQQLRYHEPQTEIFRNNVIRSIDILLLDNQKRVKNTISFTNAFITQLTSLNLTMGTSDELTFTCAFQYEEVSRNRQDNQTSLL